MKHKHKNRILGRVATDRRALLSNLASALLRHGSIETSEAKAKELRGFLEPLITKAKQKTTLHIHRQLLRILPTKEDVTRLFETAKEQQKRSGGYVRLTRLPRTRKDASAQAKIEIL